MSENNDDIPNIPLRPPLIYLLFLLAGLLLGQLQPLSVSPDFLPDETRWALSLVLFLGGAAFMGWGITTLAKAGEHPNPRKPTGAMVADGPFRFTRNPLYISLLMIQLSLALMANSGLATLASIPTIVTIHFLVVLREEAYLEKKFGAAYADYRARTGRWLIW